MNESRTSAGSLPGHTTRPSKNVWFKSSFSESSSCVEVRFDEKSVSIRDGKDRTRQDHLPAERRIVLTRNAWAELLNQVTQQRYAPLASDLGIDYRGDGVVGLRCGRTNTYLTFTIDEWDAFVAGARCGEFDLHSAKPAQKSPRKGLIRAKAIVRKVIRHPYALTFSRCLQNHPFMTAAAVTTIIATTPLHWSVAIGAGAAAALVVRVVG